ncbi:MAG: PQQ-dependent sugar dehydrogenase [Burkholderiales bacterium]
MRQLHRELFARGSRARSSTMSRNSVQRRRARWLHRRVRGTLSIDRRGENSMISYKRVVMVAGALILTAALLPRPALGEPAFILEPIAIGFSDPLGIVSAQDGSGRLFIVQQGGQIRVFDGQNVLPAPFLNISALVSCCGERGLLGLAFDPQYTTNGHFYVNYTDSAGNTVIARYTVSANADVANPGSAQIILTVAQPFANHNGGQLQFGPDGFLYIAMGDGGSGGDPDNRSQNLGVLLGKLLRIDVNGPLPYSIPASNPFAFTPGARGEIWAYGLRNPWRFGFDRLNGDLFIADVGQNALEELNWQSASSIGGENYGWRLMEGSQCFNPPTNCNDGSLTLPILEYDHSLGCAIIGGYRYRGTRFAAMQGVYFYGDVCSGRIWGATDASGIWQSRELADTGLSITSFGEDESGEIYVADAASGTIYRVTMQGLGLAPPVPGAAGTVNTFGVTGATPGAQIVLNFGARLGSTPIPGCPGVFRDILEPKVGGVARADADGRTSFSIPVPAIHGRTVLFQAIERSTCSDSNLVEYRFP